MTKANVNNRSFVITYFKLGYLLHLITAIELILMYGCFKYFNLLDWVQEGNSFLKYVLLLCIVFPPVFPQLDIRSRYQNYKQVKDHLYLYGFQQRIVKPFSQSRCQRDAVIAAAEELGYKQACKIYFGQLGYRWYHLLPDMLMRNPTYLFHKMFWLNTFFAKTYQSKVNFKSLEKSTDFCKNIRVASIKTAI